MESLVLAGALDTLQDIKREQFFTLNSKEEQVMESLIKYGNLHQQDREFNQNSLFGALENAVEVTKPEIPYTAEWSPLVKLNKEREMIGMYLSAHPMDEFEFEMNDICNANTVTIKDLSEYKLGAGLKMGGMITNFRTGTSKTGKPYGIFTLEDYHGSHEFPLFGKNYDDYGKYLIKDLFVFIQAVVQEKGSDYRNYTPDPNVKPEIELKIMNIMPFKEVRKMIKRIRIFLSLQKLTNDVVEELTDIITDNKGDVNVYVEIKDFYTLERVTLFARPHRMKITSAVYQYLKRAVEEELLTYKIEMT